MQEGSVLEDSGDETRQSRSRTHLLRESGRSAILDRVALVLSEGGLSMSMSDVAEAVGVGRATLYRYFPTRQALLDSIYSQAMDELAEMISSTRRAGLSTRESLARIARAVLAKAGVALLLMRERVVLDKAAVEEGFIAPLSSMIEKAERSDVFAEGISSRAITFYFLGLLRSGIVLVAEGTSTVEEAAANVVTLLFDGIGGGSAKTWRD